MIVNNCMTVFHKGIDKTTRLEKWTRYNYGSKNNYTVWAHGGFGARFQKGFAEANDLKIRIPYDLNDNLDVSNFEIEDIIVLDEITTDINMQSDLDGYDVFKIKSITNDNFGDSPHIYLGCK